MSDENLAWHNPLGEAVAEWSEIKQMDSMDKFVDYVGNLRTMQGQSIRIPSEEASAEDVSKFTEKVLAKVPSLMRAPGDDISSEALSSIFQRLGTPEAIEGYKVPESDDLMLSENAMTDLAGFAHKNNMTQKQFEALAEKMGKANSKSDYDNQERIHKEQALIKDVWGFAFGDRMNEVQAFLETTQAPESLRDAFSNNQMDAASLQWVYAMREATRESAPISEQMQRNKEAKTLAPAEAKARISEMYGNSETVNKLKQGDPEAQAKLDSLYAKAYP